MNPDTAFVALLFILLAAMSWRTAAILFGVGFFVYSLHAQLGYW